MDDMKLLMNHLPKCAGNAFAHQFQTLLGKDAVFEIRPAHEPQLEAARFDRFAFIYGHLTRRQEEEAAGNRQRFTVLRDPVDRVLSAYHFFMQLKAANSPITAKVDAMSIEEYMTSGDTRVRRTTCNEQARQLLGWDSQDIVSPEHAEQIVTSNAKLLDRFFLIGIYEEFRQTLNLLSWTLGLPRLRSIHVNRTSDNWKARPVAPAVTEAIRVRNTVDQALYNRCRRMFRNTLETMEEDLLGRSYFRVHGGVDTGFDVDFGRPVSGSGWYDPETVGGRTYRWMGGEEGACVYLPLDGRHAAEVTIDAPIIFATVSDAEISLAVDGQVIPARIIRNGRGAAIVCTLAADPSRAGRVLSLRSKSWRAPLPQDGRSLAVAVSRLTVRPLPPSVQSAQIAAVGIPALS